MILRSVEPAAEPGLARALLAVQRQAYAKEADLIQDDRIPPLHEDLDALRSAPLLWVAAFDDEELLGAVAWTEEGSVVDVDRLVVAGTVHRRGVGTRLVTDVLRRADWRTTTVSTGRANVPARRLYERLGFGLVGDREVLPGLWVTDYAYVPALHGRHHGP
ncbi:GNAT family N-acetyltransferase [Actinotalea sp. Marseille-Q4924]|uniref:GNAT family N-acetyltransferase n=1 Tax=Actinotalea sp. Marseille-Q4924 TaxID=2866571 RepID=UPI001CE42401|nr:GNAT family N-acetyltransferase [Actinotalea sp. Marseille-Q4924]